MSEAFFCLETYPQIEPSFAAVNILNLAKGHRDGKKLKRGHIFCRLTTRSWCITLQCEFPRLGNHAISFMWSRWRPSTASFACFLVVNGITSCKIPQLSGRSRFVLDSFFFVFLSGAAWMILKCFNDSTRSPLSCNGQHEGWIFVKLTLFA